MACPICGQPSSCPHEQKGAAYSVGAGEKRAAGSREYSSLPLNISQPEEILDIPGDRFWRQEVVSRLQQHRARRRSRVDPQASMELDFKAGSDGSVGAKEMDKAVRGRPLARPEQPKIIEFPRPAIAPAIYAALDRLHQSEEIELADPIVDGPRILDAPEPPPRQLDLLPAFSDIQLEAEQDRRAGEVELPPRPAAVSARLYAGLVDWMIVSMASSLFVFVFLLFAKALPQARSSIIFALIVCGALWLTYQYLFLVYSSRTAGMRLAHLELCTFTGEPAPVDLRRKRALASTLSALAVGLGFAWALVDDDTLGWHDRITQTYLKHSAGPRRQERTP